MGEEQQILAVDQGTSGTKAVVFDREGRIVSKAASALNSLYPRPGFVEQDPLEIYRNVLESVGRCLADAGGNGGASLRACGLSNQRETFLLWDDQGQPLCRAIVWQCKRSIAICGRLKQSGLEEEIRRRTGLIVDPYFSGTKLIWLAEHDPDIARAIKSGAAYFGTVDTWLLYRLTAGKVYRTDFTNACRTLFFNLETLDWDRELLREFGLEGLNLPEAHPSSFDFGESDFEGLLDRPIPIGSMVGDSHGAAFGEGCFSSGAAKATLGTGCSILLNTEGRRVTSRNGMVTTICWSTGDRVDYALEGIIVTAGAAVQWLRDQLGLVGRSGQTEAMAQAVADNNGVYLVPAFSGLGAPHWKMSARAAIVNLTFDCNRNHVVRAALESVAYQIRDVVTAMESDSGLALKALAADGGMTANRFVMQFLADLLGTPVIGSGIEEVSALGAAWLAGLQSGLYGSIGELERLSVQRRVFEAGEDRRRVEGWYEGWREAVRRVY